MFLYFRCWSSYKSSISAPQGHLGRSCGGQRAKEDREGTAVERLFAAAGLILDAKRSKLDPAWVDHILFLREVFLLGTCKLDWE